MPVHQIDGVRNGDSNLQTLARQMNTNRPHIRCGTCPSKNRLLHDKVLNRSKRVLRNREIKEKNSSGNGPPFMRNPQRLRLMGTSVISGTDPEQIKM